MRKVFARIGLLASLTLPMVGIGATFGATTAHADINPCPDVMGQPNRCLSDTVTLSGHATLESVGGEVTPCNLPEMGGPLCDYDVDANASCSGTSDPASSAGDEANKTCALTADGSISTNTACGTGNVSVNFSVDENPASPGTETVSGTLTLSFVSGSATFSDAGVTEKDADSGTSYPAFASGTVTVTPTGANPPTTCATGFNFTADATITEAHSRP